jgi:hypothetical protein
MHASALRFLIPFTLVVLLLPACSDSNGEAADTEAEVLATVEGFGAAVNAYDTEAIPEYVTDDFTWQSTGPVQNLVDYLAYVDANYEMVGFHVEATGDPAIRVDDEEYVVEQEDLVTATGLRAAGTTTLRLVEVDGVWLIRETRWVEETADSSG